MITEFGEALINFIWMIVIIWLFGACIKEGGRKLKDWLK